MKSVISLDAYRKDRGNASPEVVIAALDRLRREAQSEIERRVLIAVRTYLNLDPESMRESVCRDFMYRTACGSFVLKLTGGDEPDSELEYSLEGVFNWLNELPEQIERSVIDFRPLVAPTKG